jgi:hypothetical protein
MISKKEKFITRKRQRKVIIRFFLVFNDLEKEPRDRKKIITRIITATKIKKYWKEMLKPFSEVNKIKHNARIPNIVEI